MKAFEILHIRIDPALYKKLKLLCVEEEMSIQAFVTDMIEVTVLGHEEIKKE